MAAKGSLPRGKFAGTKPTSQLKLFRHSSPYFYFKSRGHYIKKNKKKQIAKK
jgi:hypothetical protein